ncbi:MAG: hypothetical protein HC856_03410 [Pseudanabaena sp. RU_4_16]|nr:hypothetical protein [Pseudanabaena sp. RU_4_16]
MQYKQTQELSDRQFKRLVGVKRETFDEMVKVARQQAHPKKKQGCPTKLSLEDRVLVSLQYWREYRTYFHMAQDWGVSESTICRIVHHVETTLIRSGKFRLAGKNSLLRGFERPETVVLDVMESPIERPQQGQKQFYSGKKGRHSLKSQIVIAPS